MRGTAAASKSVGSATDSRPSTPKTGPDSRPSTPKKVDFKLPGLDGGAVNTAGSQLATPGARAPAKLSASVVAEAPSSQSDKRRRRHRKHRRTRDSTAPEGEAPLRERTVAVPSLQRIPPTSTPRPVSRGSESLIDRPESRGSHFTPRTRLVRLPGSRETQRSEARRREERRKALGVKPKKVKLEDYVMDSTVKDIKSGISLPPGCVLRKVDGFGKNVRARKISAAFDLTAVVTHDARLWTFGRAATDDKNIFFPEAIDGAGVVRSVAAGRAGRTIALDERGQPILVVLRHNEKAMYRGGKRPWQPNGNEERSDADLLNRLEAVAQEQQLACIPIPHFAKRPVRMAAAGTNHVALLTWGGQVWSFGSGNHGELGLGRDGHGAIVSMARVPQLISVAIPQSTVGDDNSDVPTQSAARAAARGDSVEAREAMHSREDSFASRPWSVGGATALHRFSTPFSDPLGTGGLTRRGAAGLGRPGSAAVLSGRPGSALAVMNGAQIDFVGSAADLQPGAPALGNGGAWSDVIAATEKSAEGGDAEAGASGLDTSQLDLLPDPRALELSAPVGDGDANVEGPSRDVRAVTAPASKSRRSSSLLVAAKRTKDAAAGAKVLTAAEVEEAEAEAAAAVAAAARAAKELPPEPRVGHMRHATVIFISAGAHHTAALTDGGDIFTWGRGHTREQGNPLGHGDLKDAPVPKRVSSLRHHTIVHVSAGDRHSLAVSETGWTFSWGDGESGQLGHGDQKSLTKPKYIEALRHLAYRKMRLPKRLWQSRVRTGGGAGGMNELVPSFPPPEESTPGELQPPGFVRTSSRASRRLKRLGREDLMASREQERAQAIAEHAAALAAELTIQLEDAKARGEIPEDAVALVPVSVPSSPALSMGTSILGSLNSLGHGLATRTGLIKKTEEIVVPETEGEKWDRIQGLDGKLWRPLTGQLGDVPRAMSASLRAKLASTSKKKESHHNHHKNHHRRHGQGHADEKILADDVLPFYVEGLPRPLLRIVGGVAAGGRHSACWTSDGQTVLMWGSISDGRLGPDERPDPKKKKQKGGDVAGRQRTAPQTSGSRSSGRSRVISRLTARPKASNPSSPRPGSSKYEWGELPPISAASSRPSSRSEFEHDVELEFENKDLELRSDLLPVLTPRTSAAEEQATVREKDYAYTWNKQDAIQNVPRPVTTQLLQIFDGDLQLSWRSPVFNVTDLVISLGKADSLNSEHGGSKRTTHGSSGGGAESGESSGAESGGEEGAQVAMEEEELSESESSPSSEEDDSLDPSTNEIVEGKDALTVELRRLAPGAAARFLKLALQRAKKNRRRALRRSAVIVSKPKMQKIRDLIESNSADMDLRDELRCHDALVAWRTTVVRDSKLDLARSAPLTNKEVLPDNDICVICCVAPRSAATVRVVLSHEFSHNAFAISVITAREARARSKRRMAVLLTLSSQEKMVWAKRNRKRGLKQLAALAKNALGDKKRKAVEVARRKERVRAEKKRQRKYATPSDLADEFSAMVAVRQWCLREQEAAALSNAKTFEEHQEALRVVAAEGRDSNVVPHPNFVDEDIVHSNDICTLTCLELQPAAGVPFGSVLCGALGWHADASAGQNAEGAEQFANLAVADTEELLRWQREQKEERLRHAGRQVVPAALIESLAVVVKRFTEERLERRRRESVAGMKARFDAFDTDGSGSISFEELMKLLRDESETFNLETGKAAEKRRRAEKKMSRKQLRKKEKADALVADEAERPPLGESDVRRLFKEFDADRSGEIEWDEFEALLKAITAPPELEEEYYDYDEEDDEWESDLDSDELRKKSRSGPNLGKDYDDVKIDIGAEAWDNDDGDDDDTEEDSEETLAERAAEAEAFRLVTDGAVRAAACAAHAAGAAAQSASDRVGQPMSDGWIARFVLPDFESRRGPAQPAGGSKEAELTRIAAIAALNQLKEAAITLEKRRVEEARLAALAVEEATLNVTDTAYSLAYKAKAVKKSRWSGKDMALPGGASSSSLLKLANSNDGALPGANWDAFDETADADAQVAEAERSIARRESKAAAKAAGRDAEDRRIIGNLKAYEGKDATSDDGEDADGDGVAAVRFDWPSGITASDLKSEVTLLDRYRIALSGVRRINHEIRVMRTFELFDEDGSGAIDEWELMSAFRNLGARIDRLDAFNIIDKYDKDRSNTIDASEFLTYCIDEGGLSEKQGVLGRMAAATGLVPSEKKPAHVDDTGVKLLQHMFVAECSIRGIDIEEDPRQRRIKDRFFSYGATMNGIAHGKLNLSNLRGSRDGKIAPWTHQHLEALLAALKAAPVIADLDLRGSPFTLDGFKALVQLVEWHAGVVLPSSFKPASREFSRCAMCNTTTLFDSRFKSFATCRHLGCGNENFIIRPANLLEKVMGVEEVQVPLQVAELTRRMQLTWSERVECWAAHTKNPDPATLALSLSVQAGNMQSLFAGPAVVQSWRPASGDGDDLNDPVLTITDIASYETGFRAHCAAFRDRRFPALGRRMAGKERRKNARAVRRAKAIRLREERKRKKEIEKMRKRFAEVDADGSGSIDSAEVMKLLPKSVSKELGEIGVAGLIARFDADASGTIDVTELWAMLREIRRLSGEPEPESSSESDLGVSEDSESTDWDEIEKLENRRAAGGGDDDGFLDDAEMREDEEAAAAADALEALEDAEPTERQLKAAAAKAKAKEVAAKAAKGLKAGALSLFHKLMDSSDSDASSEEEAGETGPAGSGFDPPTNMTVGQKVVEKALELDWSRQYDHIIQLSFGTLAQPFYIATIQTHAHEILRMLYAGMLHDIRCSFFGLPLDRPCEGADTDIE